MARYRQAFIVAAAALLLCAVAQPAMAMHISEGILPGGWAALWLGLAAPFVAWGTWRVQRRSDADPRFKSLVALAGAAVFIISCMPIPVLTAGSCSHPCGTGLAAIVIGPGATVVVASIALLLQALFMLHGGLTTIGANVLSMGVAGALTGYTVYRLLRAARLPVVPAAFAAGLLSDWATYAMTSAELAWALHGNKPFGAVFIALLLGFVPTQLPLGIFEGILTAGACRFIMARRPELLAAPAAVAPRGESA